MIREQNLTFSLNTAHTSYVFRVMPSGHLEHLYYGRKITLHTNDTKAASVLFEKHTFPPGNTNFYSEEHKNISLEDMCLEMSSYGKGDVREPFIELVHEDGSYTSDFLFQEYTISQGKKPYDTLPGSYDEKDGVEELSVVLTDRYYHLELVLSYFV